MTMKVKARAADITRDAASSNRNGRERKVLVSMGSSTGYDDHLMVSGPRQVESESLALTAGLFAVSDVFRHS